MKQFTILLVAIFTNALILQTALAEGKMTTLVPLPSVEDFTGGEDGWGVGIGLGVEYEAAYEGSDEFGIEVDPAGGVQWRNGEDVFFWAGEAVGWRGLRSDIWLLEVVLAFDEGREESNSDDGRLEGLGDQDESTEFVLQARYALEVNWRYWLDIRAVTGEYGSLGLLGIGRRFGNQNDGSGSELSIAIVYHDSDFANKGFGINAAQAAASGFKETDISGGFRSIGANYIYRQYVNNNWQIFGELVYEHYSNDIADSPLSRSDYEAEVGAGFIYVF